MGKAIAAAVRRITAWSHSRFKDWTKCPRYAHWKHVLKKPEGPKSPAMQRGGDIHREGEHYLGIYAADLKALKLDAKAAKLYEKAGRVTMRLKKVPASFAAFRKEMEALREAKAVAEGKRALSVAWAVVDFFDWAGAWLRVVYDAKLALGKLVRIIDFKTGKIYPDDNDDQMELYALVGFAEHAEAERVSTELWYLDQPRVADQKRADANPRTKVFERRQLAGLQKKWRMRVSPMLSDVRFVPTPGRQCSWCAYSKRKGGECQY